MPILYAILLTILSLVANALWGWNPFVTACGLCIAIPAAILLCVGLLCVLEEVICKVAIHFEKRNRNRKEPNV